MHTHIAFLSTEEKARPVGVRVVEPPADTRHAVRGNLYVVVEYSGEDPEKTQLVERALSVIQRTYYTVKGTQTFVLTEALREGLALFPAATNREKSAASTVPGILLVALLGNQLVATGTGPAVALLTAGSSVDVYPPYIASANATTRTAEAQQTPDLYRHEIPQGGTVMIAGQRCLQHFTLRELASIVAYVTEENVVDVAATLREQAGVDQLTGLLAVIVPQDDAPAAPPPSTPRPRKSRTALPGALSARLPAPSAAEPVTQSANRPTVQRSAPMSKEGAAVATATSTSAELPVDPNAQERTEPAAPTAESLPWAAATTAAAARGETAAPFSTARLKAMAEQAVVQTRTFFERILPDRTGNATAAESSPRAETRANPVDESPAEATTEATYAAAGQQQPLSVNHSAPQAYADETFAPTEQTNDPGMDENLESAAGVGAHTHRAAPLGEMHQDIDATDPRFAPQDAAAPLAAPRVAKPKRAMDRRARLFALVAVLILLVTVVTVATVFWTAGRTNIEAANELLVRAEANMASAQDALASEDKVTARRNLLDAQALIVEANSVVGTRMERADQLSATVEQQLAELLQVQPLHALAMPLVRFDGTANPQQVIVADRDIYVLDTGLRTVTYYELDATGNLVTNVQGEPILAEGDVVDNVPVGRLVNITWMPAIAGVQDKAYLLILDGNNNLFGYDRRVEGESFISLGGQDQLRSPAQMQVYFDRLYVADAGANQIFRYGRGDFSSPPEAWFSAQTETSLGTMRAMAIDGSIWLLFEQGLLSRFNGGTQVQFSLEDSFGMIDDPVDLFVGNESTSSIYIADGRGERILVFDKSGKYLRQLRAPEGDALRNLRGIFVDEVGGVMYILTQSALYNHPLMN